MTDARQPMLDAQLTPAMTAQEQFASAHNTAPHSPAKGSSQRNPDGERNLPFLAVGRLHDAKILLSVGARSLETEKIFGKLLEAATLKMQPGKRVRLQWRKGTVCCALDERGEILYCVVTKDESYPERLAFQLLSELNDFAVSRLRGDGQQADIGSGRLTGDGGDIGAEFGSGTLSGSYGNGQEQLMQMQPVSLAESCAILGPHHWSSVDNRDMLAGLTNNPHNVPDSTGLNESNADLLLRKMAGLLDTYENPAQADRYFTLYEKTKLVQSQAEQSLRKVMENQEPMQALEIKGNDLEMKGSEFEGTSRAARNRMWYRNKCFIFAMVILFLFPFSFFFGSSKDDDKKLEEGNEKKEGAEGENKKTEQEGEGGKKEGAEEKRSLLALSSSNAGHDELRRDLASGGATRAMTALYE